MLEDAYPRCWSRGVGRLFIGDCLSALHWAGIFAGYIINCYNEDSPFHPFCVRMWLNIGHRGEMSGITWKARLEEAVKMVFSALLHGQNVLVHCFRGRHRSGAFVIFCIALIMGWDLETARSAYLRRRPDFDDRDRPWTPTEPWTPLESAPATSPAPFTPPGLVPQTPRGPVPKTPSPASSAQTEWVVMVEAKMEVVTVESATEVAEVDSATDATNIAESPKCSPAGSVQSPGGSPAPSQEGPACSVQSATYSPAPSQEGDDIEEIEDDALASSEEDFVGVVWLVTAGEIEDDDTEEDIVEVMWLMRDDGDERNRFFHF